MRQNIRAINNNRNHEGVKAAPMSDYEALVRTVSSCFLWESEFYEDGEDIAKRIASLSHKLPNDQVLGLALRLRKVDGIRHAPLMMVAACALKRDGDPSVSKAIGKIISRPDEAGELLAISARIQGKPAANLGKITPPAIIKGIAKAFRKFDAYQLAKYDRNTGIKLRDVLRLSRPKPKDQAQSDMWKRLLNGELSAPDTWEVALSSGEDKKASFERLLRSGKMPYMALLRNLRNMNDSGVERDLVKDAIISRKGAKRVLPFRYIAAARACPTFEPQLDEAMQYAVQDLPMLTGKTVVMVDVSYSMFERLSKKSDMTRIDAATGLAALVNGDDVRVFSFSDSLVEVARRHGMAGIDAIRRSQPNRGTRLGAAITELNRKVRYDRLIVITDEQSQDRVPDPSVKNAYMVNVASSDKSINFGAWKRISGFSENIFRFIEAHENPEVAQPTPFIGGAGSGKRPGITPDEPFEEFGY